MLTDLHLEEITRKENPETVGTPDLQLAYWHYVQKRNGGTSGDSIREIGASLQVSHNDIISFEGLRLLRQGRKDYWSLLYELNPFPETGLCLGQRVAVMFPQNMRGAVLVYSNASQRDSLPAGRIKTLIEGLARKFEQAC